MEFKEFARIFLRLPFLILHINQKDKVSKFLFPIFADRISNHALEFLSLREEKLGSWWVRYLNI